MTEIIDFLKKYTDGKQNTEKVEISVIQLNRVIKALEQEPTTKNDLAVDCISREQAIEETDKLCLETGYDNEKVEEMLRDLPSVTPQELKRGHWICKESSEYYFYGKCSECGQEFQIDAWYTQNMKYCPNCGAKMVEPQESEEEIMLHEEVEKYINLSGDKKAWQNTSVSRIGGYLDGYDKGLEVLDKIRAEIEFEVDHRNNMLCAEDVFEIIDKYKAEGEGEK